MRTLTFVAWFPFCGSHFHDFETVSAAYELTPQNWRSLRSCHETRVERCITKEDVGPNPVARNRVSYSNVGMVATPSMALSGMRACHRAQERVQQRVDSDFCPGWRACIS